MKKLALLSVSDKTGIVEFARQLINLNFNILSTGGTAKLLMENDVPVIKVSDYTEHPEILDGRVKTLHPKIHAGILAKDDPVNKSYMEKYGYRYIDLVAVNLYPFEKTVAKEGVTFEEAIEQIDIGGPTILRAAAKNCDRVIAVCNSSDYGWIINSLTKFGELSIDCKRELAAKVFKLVAFYNISIVGYFDKII